jgi:hypothetical protein
MAERCHTTAIDTSQEVWALQWVILYRYTLGILVPHEGKLLTPSWPHIVNASDKVAAAGLVIDYWPNNINIAVWVTIMLVVIIGLNFMPVRFYGETEFWFAGTKVILLVGLLMLSFILFWGRGPQQNGVLIFHYWKQPGAANTYLVGGDTGRFVAFWENSGAFCLPIHIRSRTAGGYGRRDGVTAPEPAQSIETLLPSADLLLLPLCACNWLHLLFECLCVNEWRSR